MPTTLTGRLVATAIMLMTTVSLLIAAATAAAIHAYLTGRLDNEISESVAIAARSYEEHGSPSSWRRERSRDQHERYERDERGVGQRTGTLTAYLGDGLTEGDVINATTGFESLSTGALHELSEVPADGRAHRVELPELGHYRVEAHQAGDGTIVLAGLPTARVDETVTGLATRELVLSTLGVLAAGLAASVLVRRQLQPLREVARTAHTVSTLPLDTGEIGMTARVPDRLTDERSEVGQVGAALNTLLGHVEGALDSRHRSEQQVRQFVADASHELRTPLATIKGYAELSRRSAEPAPETERLLMAMGKVEAEAARMSSLVEDLLLLARLDAGRPLERTQVDLTKLVLESVGDARVVAPEHRWRLELDEEPVIVTGDELRLHQVVTNLLSNARRHTPAGTVVTVAATWSPDHRSAEITVHDDGPGIAEELQGSVFERFTRGDSARTRASGGVGLGLSLVKAIVDAHGGRIGVESKPGATMFTVTLPA